MKNILTAAALLVLLGGTTHAVPVVYTDEATYLAGLTALGYSAVHESFEDGVVWADSRNSIVAPGRTPAVTSQGIVWTSNFSQNQIATGTVGGYTADGLYAIYSLAHGLTTDSGFYCDSAEDPDIPIECYQNDGLRVESATGDPLFAFGGRIDTANSGKVTFLLDGVDINGNDTDNIDNWQREGDFADNWAFVGVIDTDGFLAAELRELRGKDAQQVLLFADDFALGTLPGFNWIDTTPGGTNFNTPGSWSPAGPPSMNDNATVDNGGTVLVDATNTGVSRAEVSQLTIGGASSGVVSVASTGELAAAADVQLGVSGMGELRVAGSAASITIGGDMNIGVSGTLAADISGPTHSTVAVTGDVVHSGGTLDVSFSSAPVSGAHLYTLASGANYTGTFASHNVPFPIGGVGDAIGRVNPVIYTPTSVQVGLAVPGDVDFSSEVTAGGDGSTLLGSLGGGSGKQWPDGDFTGDGLVTAGNDGSILLGALSAGPYDSASGGSAQVTCNPATGYVSVDATGVALLQLVSTSGSLVPDAGALVDGFLVGAVDNPSANDLTFISMANNLGSVAGFTHEGGYLLTPGTPAGDLTVYYQRVGGSKVQGSVVIVPEPSTVTLIGLGLLGLIGWIRHLRRPALA